MQVENIMPLPTQHTAHILIVEDDISLADWIKEYLEINVKNDDQLVKMAGIVQRLISTEARAGAEDEFGLSEEEKTQLLSGIEDTIKDIQTESDKIHNKIENADRIN